MLVARVLPLLTLAGCAMDWACVPVAPSASVPVSSIVHRILVVDMSVSVFTDRRSFGPGIGSGAGSTEIGVETREELSVEETEKADIMPRSTPCLRA